MADFNPALPVPGKWSIFQNDADDKYNPNGKSLRLQIPVESVVAFGEHLVNCLDDPTQQKEMTVWDFEEREKKTRLGFGSSLDQNRLPSARSATIQTH